MRDFLGIGGTFAQTHGLADEFPDGVLTCAIGDEALHELLNTRRLAFVV